MTPPFVEVASTVQQVSAFGGNPIPVQMPSDVQAGDYLVAFTLNVAVNVTSPTILPAGWVLEQNDVFYKLADGTEGGTIVNWTTRNTSSSFGVSRAHTAIVCCYRFDQPVSFISHSPRQFFGGFGPSMTIDYGGSTGADYEFWVNCCVADTTNASILYPIFSYTWLNVTDRSGQVDNPSTIETPLDTQDASTGTVGDCSLMAGVALDPGVGIILNGYPSGLGAFMSNIKFFFPTPLEVPNYWGILSTTN